MCFSMASLRRRTAPLTLAHAWTGLQIATRPYLLDRLLKPVALPSAWSRQQLHASVVWPAVLHS